MIHKKLNIKCIYCVTIIVFVLSLLLDKEIMYFISNNRIWAFDNIFLWITNIGSTLAVLFIMTSLFLFEERKQRWILPLWATLALTSALTYIIKLIISRPRPYETLQIFALLKELTPSFPSTHAAVAFCAIPLLDKEFKRLKLFWIAFAILVAFSRVYISVHYLSDVIFGALIGYSVGYLIVKLEERHKLSKWIISSVKGKHSI